MASTVELELYLFVSCRQKSPAAKRRTITTMKYLVGLKDRVQVAISRDEKVSQSIGLVAKYQSKGSFLSVESRNEVKALNLKKDKESNAIVFDSGDRSTCFEFFAYCKLLDIVLMSDSNKLFVVKNGKLLLQASYQELTKSNVKNVYRNQSQNYSNYGRTFKLIEPNLLAFLTATDELIVIELDQLAVESKESDEQLAFRKSKLDKCIDFYCHSRKRLLYLLASDGNIQVLKITYTKENKSPSFEQMRTASLQSTIPTGYSCISAIEHRNFIVVSSSMAAHTLGLHIISQKRLVELSSHTVKFKDESKFYVVGHQLLTFIWKRVDFVVLASVYYYLHIYTIGRTNRLIPISEAFEIDNNYFNNMIQLDNHIICGGHHYMKCIDIIF